jgi:glutathione synthase/RimK-type ligase-like ATP-grasp enzyme
MQNKKPVVYFVFRKDSGTNSTRFGGFAKRMKKAGFLPNAEYRSVALIDLIFALNEQGEMAIYSKDGAKLFEDASFVYFKSWEAMPEQAGALAVYLQAKGIPFEDHLVLNMGTTKLPQMMRLWSRDLRYIPTIISHDLPSKEFVESILGCGHFILKPMNGEKGNDNYLCTSYDDVQRKVATFEKQWMLQKYIENDGDYRIWVYGYEVKGGILRSSAKGSHLNNTSKGAASSFVSTETLAGDISNMARSAALASGNAVSGVDIMPGKDGYNYILEVNQGSQIVTGHESEKKMRAFGEFIESHIGGSFKRTKQPNKLKVIGRYVHINLPEFNITEVFAKIDTGAYQSALHAKDIMEVVIDGQKALSFTMLEGHTRSGSKSKKCIAHNYDVVKVKSSTGTVQHRYRIRTKIALGGVMMNTPITLTDRSDMTSPLLLGRRFLRGRYMVNVELSRRDYEETL